MANPVTWVNLRLAGSLQGVLCLGRHVVPSIHRLFVHMLYKGKEYLQLKVSCLF